MRRKILGILALLIAVLFIVVSTKPNSFRVERSITINAAPEYVFPLINDFRQWALWSPFEKLDTNMTQTFGGSESGVGSTYEWKGNKKAGEGRMEITKSEAPTLVELKLDFIKPMEASNMTEFTVTPVVSGTDTTSTVTWVMYGPAPFITRLMTVFMSMDKMVGQSFEDGLQKMKEVVEGKQ